MSIRESILNAARKITPVDGRDYFVRNLSSKERILFHDSIKDDAGTTLETVLGQMSKLCVMCICDGDGKLVFNFADWQALLDTDTPVLQIGHQIMALNGFDIEQKKTT